MKSSGLSQKDAQVRNKWRKKINRATGCPRLTGKRPFKSLCICECVCIHCISDCCNIRVLYCIVLMSCTVHDRAVMLATGDLQEAFTSALVNFVSAMDIQRNVTAPLATVWLVFVHLKTFDCWMWGVMHGHVYQVLVWDVIDMRQHLIDRWEWLISKHCGQSYWRIA